MDLSRDKQCHLLKSYEPVLKYNKGENFLPIPINEYLRYCRLKQKGRSRKDATTDWIGDIPFKDRLPEQLNEAAEKLQRYGNDFYLQFVQPSPWAKRFWFYPVLFVGFYLAIWLVTGWSWHVLASALLALVTAWYAKTVSGVVRIAGGMFIIYALAMIVLRLTEVGLLALPERWLGGTAVGAGLILLVWFISFTGELQHPDLEKTEDKAARKRILHRMRITSRVSLNLMVAVMIASLALQRSTMIKNGSAGQVFLWAAAILLFVYDLFGLPGFLLSLFSGLPPDAVVSARQQFVSIRQSLSARQEPMYQIYGRVKEDGEFLVLQYFFFYPFNDWRTAARGLNQHEADWEMASVFLEKSALEDNNAVWDSLPEPRFIALSQHELGDFRQWSHEDLHKEGLHPIIFVALGSHANYFTPGRKPIVAEQLGKGEIGMSQAAALEQIYDQPRQFLANFQQNRIQLGRNDGFSGGTAAALQTTDLELDLQELCEGDGIILGVAAKEPKHHLKLNLLDMEDGRLPGWVKYKGFWGRTSIPGESGPPGPLWDGKNKERDRWQRPAKWLADLQR